MAESQQQSALNAELLPPQHWAELTAADAEDDGDLDSLLADNATTTESINSSILRYRTLHGRTYHSERGPMEYWGPNDNAAQEALDINNHVLTKLLGGKLHLAPIKKDIQTAVDIGTGTGIWAIDFADEYPDTKVIGTDLSPSQPSWVPPNLQFEIDDCTREWTFRENSLDYVHIRWLVGSVADWTALFKEAYKCLKPGGYIESYEPSSKFLSDDGDVPDALKQWGHFFVEGGRKIARPFTVFEDELQRKAMKEAGFIEIEEREVKNPVGAWPLDEALKEIGSFTHLAFEADAEGALLFMATQSGWSREEVAVYLAHFRRALRSKTTHAYYKQRIIWGKKPE